ncbi:hypothetical protein NIA69_18350 [Gemmiger formicilis]|nr:hypothetical protein [Gemmiger formicilis]
MSNTIWAVDGSFLPSAFRASSAIPSSCLQRWTASSRRALSKLSPRRALKRRTIPI